MFRFARASGVLHDSRLHGGFVGLVWSWWWETRDILEASAGESDSQGKLHLIGTHVNSISIDLVTWRSRWVRCVTLQLRIKVAGRIGEAYQ